MIYQLNRDPKNFLIVLSLFVMMGIALVVYFNTSPGEPRERDYVYAGSFYAFAMWIGFGVMAFKDLIVRLTKRDDRTAAVAATVIGLVVPGILCAENWDDHDRSGRTYAHDIGWNYLQSTLPNSIILNYGDNDTFPLWLNQEVDGLRPDVRIMNTSYLGGEWYIDEMKTRANEAAGVPFTLPRSKYWYRNDYVPVYERVNRPVEAREAIEFFASDDQRTKVQLSDGSSSDYLPSKTLMLPVDKQNVLRSGIVAEKDKDLIVDTVYIKLSGDYLNKGELMIVDMLSNYDWTRPIYLTQPYIFQKFGLVDYLQFDGYAYRFVPILTPYRQAGEVGRIDPEYAVPLLLDVFRYGNLDDEKVYSDYFTQYNLSAARAREAFARALFGPAHPYGITWPETAYDDLTRDDLLDFYARHYTARNCFVVCSGAADAAVVDAVAEVAGQLPAGADRAAEPFPPARRPMPQCPTQGPCSRRSASAGCSSAATTPITSGCRWWRCCWAVISGRA